MQFGREDFISLGFEAKYTFYPRCAEAQTGLILYWAHSDICMCFIPSRFPVQRSVWILDAVLHMYSGSGDWSVFRADGSWSSFHLEPTFLIEKQYILGTYIQGIG